MSWVYLIVASGFEICWLYSLKYLDWNEIKMMEMKNFSLWALYPLLGYVLFGLGNVYFYSSATKTIPVSTAFAVWLAVSLVGTKAIDVTYFKEPTNNNQLFFILLIIIGVIGLQLSSQK